MEGLEDTHIVILEQDIVLSPFLGDTTQEVGNGGREENVGFWFCLANDFESYLYLLLVFAIGVCFLGDEWWYGMRGGGSVWMRF